MSVSLDPINNSIRNFYFSIPKGTKNVWVCEVLVSNENGQEKSAFTFYLIGLKRWTDIEESILGKGYRLNRHLETASSDMSREWEEQSRDWIIGQKRESLVRETGNYGEMSLGSRIG